MEELQYTQNQNLSWSWRNDGSDSFLSFARLERHRLLQQVGNAGVSHFALHTWKSVIHKYPSKPLEKA
jgi:hypothetical protein